MSKIEGKLIYEKDIDRYVIHGIGEDEGRRYELHCGNYIECLLQGHWVGATVEMDEEGEYYLTEPALNLAGVAKSQLKVKREWGY